MSTAEVARDMDVLRRAVGDQKLSYFGFSYGTALGQYYANMFPDRVRAVVVDGVLNPDAWVGQGKARDQLQETRLRSADGAYRALREILVRCAKAGPQACPLAASGDPVASYELVAKRLRQKPVVIDDPDAGSFTVSYADFVGASLSALYSPYGWEPIVDSTETAAHHHRSAVGVAGPPRRGACGARPDRRTGACAATVRLPVQQRAGDLPQCRLHRRVPPEEARRLARAQRPGGQAGPLLRAALGLGHRALRPGRLDGTRRRRLDRAVRPADRRAGAGGGQLLGPGHQLPGRGDLGAAAAKQPAALSSDSWGHTAYGTSACVTGAVDAYLLRGGAAGQGRRLRR